MSYILRLHNSYATCHVLTLWLMASCCNTHIYLAGRTIYELSVLTKGVLKVTVPCVYT